MVLSRPAAMVLRHERQRGLLKYEFLEVLSTTALIFTKSNQQ